MVQNSPAQESVTLVNCSSDKTNTVRLTDWPSYLTRCNEIDLQNGRVMLCLASQLHGMGWQTANCGLPPLEGPKDQFVFKEALAMSSVMVCPKKRSRKSSTKTAKRIESSSQTWAFAPSPDLLGICSTCNYVETCSFRRDTPRPVIECDEFDDRVEVAHKLPQTDLESRGSSESRSDQYTGLCINCEVRATCTLRAPGLSVWHCEEYI